MSFAHVLFTQFFLPSHSLSTLIIVICSLKMFRCAFCDTSRVYLIVVFTMFFFKYDYSSATETFCVDFFFMAILFNKVLTSFQLHIACLSTLILIADLRPASETQVHSDVHCSMANHMGICIPCFCSTLLCASYPWVHILLNSFFIQTAFCLYE
jgi:hypothetical protein